MTITCKACAQTLLVADDASGKTAICPKCGQRQTIPRLASAAPPTPAPTPARPAASSRSPAKKNAKVALIVGGIAAGFMLLVFLSCSGLLVMALIVDKVAPAPRGDDAPNIKVPGPAESTKTLLVNGIECPIVLPPPCIATYNGLNADALERMARDSEFHTCKMGNDGLRALGEEGFVRHIRLLESASGNTIEAALIHISKKPEWEAKYRGIIRPRVHALILCKYECSIWASELAALYGYKEMAFDIQVNVNAATTPEYRKKYQYALDYMKKK